MSGLKTSIPPNFMACKGDNFILFFFLPCYHYISKNHFYFYRQFTDVSTVSLYYTSS